MRQIGRVSSPRVIQITDRTTLDGPTVATRVAAAGGAGGELLLLLRDKDLPRAERRRLGLVLRRLTREAGAALVVAADAELAREIDADGVHLGGDGFSSLPSVARAWPGAWISIACHTVDEVAEAAERGASAAILSPIFSTPGKGVPLGIEALARARALLDARGSSLLLAALGGVTLESAPSCVAAGASAVASIRADLTPLLRPRPRPG